MRIGVCSVGNKGIIFILLLKSIFFPEKKGINVLCFLSFRWEVKLQGNRSSVLTIVLCKASSKDNRRLGCKDSMITV